MRNSLLLRCWQCLRGVTRAFSVRKRWLVRPMLITARLVHYESESNRNMNMTKTKKHALLIISGGAVALALLPITTSAVPITGSISFNGNVTPFVNSTGTGTLATDYSMAHSLVFGQTFVSAGADGAFTAVPQNSQVVLFSPLRINPPGLPTPPTTPLWATAIGGFSFTLITLTEDILVSPFNTLTLRGTGLLSDGNPLDNNTGTWVATFTTAHSAAGATFSWNSSSSGDIRGVPDGGSTIMLLGCGMLGLALWGRKVAA